MAPLISKWHRELELFSAVKPLIILEGNVLDQYRYPVTGSIPEDTLVPLPEYRFAFSVADIYASAEQDGKAGAKLFTNRDYEEVKSIVLRAGGRDRFILLGLYVAQLAVNLFWPYLFFVQQTLGLAFFWLLLLWMLVAIMLHQFFRETQTAGWLIVPYQLWLTFAAILNFCLARLNP